MSDQEKKIRSILASCHRSFVAVAIFSFFINLLALTLPLYMLQLFLRVGTSKSLETLVLLTVVALGALTLSAMLEIVRTQILVRVGTRLDAGLTDDALVRSVQGTARRGASPQILLDIREVRGFLAGNGVMMLFDTPWVPLYIGFIYLLHPVLGHISLGAAIILFLMAMLNEAASRRPLAAAQQSGSRAMGQAEGYARNTDTIQAMGMLPSLQQRWRQSHWANLDQVARASIRIGAISAIARWLRRVVQIVLLGVGMYLVIQGDLVFGVVIAASILLGQGLRPVEGAISAWRSFVAARAAYRRLKEALSEPNVRRRDGMSLPAPVGRLSVERVFFTPSGRQRPVLKGVSFNLEPGQVLGIVGPSGAGKTTLARLIVGAARPTIGTVRLDGVELFEWNPDEIGRSIGYLPQDVQLFAGTIRDNIARMMPKASPEAVIDAAQQAGLHQQILGLPQGYDTYIGDGGAGLSGGQKQRLGLARALFGYPRLLVLDEPNANLDEAGEQALATAIAAAKSRGATIVVITHRPRLLTEADVMLVLKEGSIEAFGPREKVMEMFRQRAARVRRTAAAAGGSVHYLGKPAAPHETENVLGDGGGQ